MEDNQANNRSKRKSKVNIDDISFTSMEEDGEEELSFIDDDKVRTVIEDGFDISAVPHKILNPMKNRRKPEKYTMSIAKIGSLVIYLSIIIGLLAIIIGFVRG